jgi:hypothetical protein
MSSKSLPRTRVLIAFGVTRLDCPVADLRLNLSKLNEKEDGHFPILDTHGKATCSPLVTHRSMTSQQQAARTQQVLCLRALVRNPKKPQETAIVTREVLELRCRGSLNSVQTRVPLGHCSQPRELAVPQEFMKIDIERVIDEQSPNTPLCTPHELWISAHAIAPYGPQSLLRVCTSLLDLWIFALNDSARAQMPRPWHAPV